MRNQRFNMATIKRIMAARGLTQAKLARVLGSTNQLLYYYFTSEATIYKAKRIASALSSKDEKVEWKDLII